MKAMVKKTRKVSVLEWDDFVVLTDKLALHCNNSKCETCVLNKEACLALMIRTLAVEHIDQEHYLKEKDSCCLNVGAEDRFNEKYGTRKAE